MKPLGKQVGEVGLADAKPPGGAVEGDILARVVEDIFEQAIGQALLVAVAGGREAQLTEHVCDQQVQERETGGGGVAFWVADQPVDGQARVGGDAFLSQNGRLGQRVQKGLCELRKGIGEKEGGEAGSTRAEAFKAVGDQRKGNGDIARIQRIGLPADLHGNLAAQHAGKLHDLMNVQREGIAGHASYEEILTSRFIKQFHTAYLMYG